MELQIYLKVMFDSYIFLCLYLFLEFILNKLLYLFLYLFNSTCQAFTSFSFFNLYLTFNGFFIHKFHAQMSFFHQLHVIIFTFIYSILHVKPSHLLLFLLIIYVFMYDFFQSINSHSKRPLFIKFFILLFWRS